MRETTISWIKGEQYIYYFSNDPNEIKYIKKLIAEDDEVELMYDQTNQEEGGIEIALPKKYYKRPKAPRKMSEEARQKASERLKKAREEKKQGEE